MSRFYIPLDETTRTKVLPRFSSITSIGNHGLQNAFYNCTGITEVHFKSSLSGNSECTASNMGCTNATVYFDL